MRDTKEAAAARAGASGRFVIRMEPGLHAALRAGARAAGVSLNDYCVQKLAAPGPAGGDAAQVVTRAAAIAGESLVGVAVFGSWARGEATASSDVDVLIVLAAGTGVRRELYRQWDVLPVRWEGRPVEPHFVALPAAAARVTGLWAELSVDGVVLYECGFALSRWLGAVRGQIAAGAVVRRWSNGHPYWVAA
jgi:hypothetical protein